MRLLAAASRRPRGFALAIVAALALSALAGGCVRLVSEYDEQMDKGASDLDRKVIALIIDNVDDGSSGGDSRAYKANAKRYTDIKSDARVLKVRAIAQAGQNNQTIQIVDTIQDNIADLERLHAISPTGFAPAEASAVLTQFDVQFGALIALELAKKRNDDAKSAKK
jgi:hypothetical protein